MITFGLVLQHSSAIIMTISVIIIIVLVNYTVLFFLLSQSMPSERLRNQLTLMSTALHKSINKIQPEIIKVKYFKCSCTQVMQISVDKLQQNSFCTILSVQRQLPYLFQRLMEVPSHSNSYVFVYHHLYNLKRLNCTQI